MHKRVPRKLAGGKRVADAAEELRARVHARRVRPYGTLEHTEVSARRPAPQGRTPRAETAPRSARRQAHPSAASGRAAALAATVGRPRCIWGRRLPPASKHWAVKGGAARGAAGGSQDR